MPGVVQPKAPRTFKGLEGWGLGYGSYGLGFELQVPRPLGVLNKLSEVCNQDYPTEPNKDYT